MLIELFEKFTQCTFLSDNNRSLSYSNCLERVQELGRQLSHRGISTNSRVYLKGEASLEYVETILALNLLGACVTPINLLDEKNLDYYKTELGLKEGEDLILNDKLELCFKNHTKRDKEDFIIFSSGSSGNPKGAILNFENFFSNASEMNKRIKLGIGDTYLLSLPLFHVGGLSILYRSLLSGSSVFIPENVTIKSIENAILYENISHISLLPSVLKELIKNNRTFEKLKSFKTILLGGENAEQNLLEQVKDFNIIQCYGMTETCSSIFTSDKKELGNVGTAFNNIEWKLESSGNILVKGKPVFTGYLNEKHDKNAFTDGFFITNDIGEINSKNELILKDRADSMFISGGENIYPSEIEKIATRFNDVIESAVVAKDDKKWGKRPVLFIKTSNDFQLEKFNSYLKESLSKIKIPDKIIVLDKIPRMANNKVDYQAVRKSINSE